MNRLTRLIVLACVSCCLAKSGYAAIILFTDRANFGANTTFAAGISDTTGVTFLSPYCGASPGACPTVGDNGGTRYNKTSTTVGNMILTSVVAGLEIFGAGGTVNSTGLLFHLIEPTSFASLTTPAGNQGFVMGRSRAEASSNGAIIAITLPYSTTFAVDLALVCRASGLGCGSQGAQTTGPIRLTFKDGTTVVGTQDMTSNASGFRLVTGRSDVAFNRIELQAYPTVSNTDINGQGSMGYSVALTALAFGNYTAAQSSSSSSTSTSTSSSSSSTSSSSGGPTELPEPQPVQMFVIGAALVLVRQIRPARR